MKKREIRSYIAGIVTAVLVFGFCIPTIAASIQKQMTVTYKDIKICVDGNEIVPKDANGNVVEPFVSNGTTYLPVRAVGEALGKEVTWDGTTNTVYVGQRPDNTTSTTPIGTVLMEKNGIKITYAGVQPTDSYLGGYGVKLQVENTSSKNYTIQVRNFTANDFMTSTVFSCDVAAGKKANDEILIYQSALDENGIATINNLEFDFHVFNDDNWSDRFDFGPIVIQVK